MTAYIIRVCYFQVFICLLSHHLVLDILCRHLCIGHLSTQSVCTISHTETTIWYIYWSSVVFIILETTTDDGASLPTLQDDEFRPFMRQLPEYRLWYVWRLKEVMSVLWRVSMNKSLLIASLLTCFDVLDIPVYWPILLIYFIFLFFYMMRDRIQVENIVHITTKCSFCSIWSNIVMFHLQLVNHKCMLDMLLLDNDQDAIIEWNNLRDCVNYWLFSYCSNNPLIVIWPKIFYSLNLPLHSMCLFQLVSIMHRIVSYFMIIIFGIWTEYQIGPVVY
jgi:hypothetical protein